MCKKFSNKTCHNDFHQNKNTVSNRLQESSFSYSKNRWYQTPNFDAKKELNLFFLIDQKNSITLACIPNAHSYTANFKSLQIQDSCQQKQWLKLFNGIYLKFNFNLDMNLLLSLVYRQTNIYVAWNWDPQCLSVDVL